MKKTKWIASQAYVLASQIKDLLTSFPAENSRAQKRLLAICMAAMMALFAAGCKNSSDGQDSVPVEITVTPPCNHYYDGETCIYCGLKKSVIEGYTIDASGKLTKYTGMAEEFTIPEGVTEIGNEAFTNCKTLKKVTLGKDVKIIGNKAFSWCTNLASVTIPGSVTSIGDCAFYECTSLASVTIPDSVTSIGDYAFWGCTSLANVTIPDNVTSIGKGSFYKCTNLASVTIPGSVTSIGDSAFSWCTSLESVTIPDSVTSIGDSAFYECTSIASVTIGNGVKTIGTNAFGYHHENLKTVNYGGTKTQWEAITGDGKSFFDTMKITCTDGDIPIK